MLSNKAKYGLKAMIHLARMPAGVPISIQEIADRQNISKKFLDAILLQLRVKGLLQSLRGKAGGYALARPANEIFLGEIVRVLDGPIAPIPCASKYSYRPCADCDVEVCRVRKIMTQVRDAMCEVLDNTDLETVAKCDLPAEKILNWAI